MTTSDQLNPPRLRSKRREAELKTKLNKKENSIILFNSKTKLHFHHKWILCSKWPPGNWSIITKLSGKSSFLSLFSIHLPHVLFFIWIYIQMNINSIKKNLLILLLLFLLQFCGKMTDLKEIIGLLIVVKRNFCVWKLRSLFENYATLKGGRGLVQIPLQVGWGSKNRKFLSFPYKTHHHDHIPLFQKSLPDNSYLINHL